MAKGESDALSAALAATDAELFATALGHETAVHDDTNDRGLEQQDRSLEGKVEHDGEAADEVEAADGEAAEVDQTEVAAKDGDKADETGGPKRDADGKFVKADAEAPAKEADKADPKDGRVPSAVVRESNEKRRAAEAERDALKAAREDDKREREALKAQVELLGRQFAQRQAPEPAKPEASQRPDKFADPEGYDTWVEQQIAAARNETREDFSRRLVNMNLANTREVHGEKFDAAYQGILTAAQTEPEARLAIQKIWHSDNPGAELLRWHRDRETLREVGADPVAYRKKVADETRAALLADPDFRKEMLAGLKAEAGGNGVNGNGAARHVIRVPTKTIPSLNGASGSAQAADTTFDDASEDGFFNRALHPAG